MSSFDNLPKLSDENNPYPMTVPSGDAMRYDQQGIFPQSVAAAPTPRQKSHPFEGLFEFIGSILEILGNLIELFR